MIAASEQATTVKKNNWAALVAIVPAIMIPVMFALERVHAPDFVVGFWSGSMIVLQILLLAFAVRSRKCDRADDQRGYQFLGCYRKADSPLSP